MAKVVAAAVLILLSVHASTAAEDVLACLQYRGDGCQSIQDKQFCLSSRDGSRWKDFQDIPIQGQRCVWCGGQLCTGQRSSLCESYEFVQWHRGNVFRNATIGQTQTYTAATCQKEETILSTLAALPSMLLGACENCEDAVRAKQADDFVLLDGSDHACRGAHPLDTGALPSPVPGQGKEFSYSVWTAGTVSACRALCKEGCFGIEYKEADKYCEVWHKPIQFTAAAPGFRCFRKTAQPESSVIGYMSSVDTSCLSVRDAGCRSAMDEKSCLSSLQKGDPMNEQCVWCGGGLCSTDSASLCQPFSSLLTRSANQQGAATLKVAGCVAGKSVGLPPPALPVATPDPAAALTPVAGAAQPSTPAPTQLPPPALPDSPRVAETPVIPAPPAPMSPAAPPPAVPTTPAAVPTPAVVPLPAAVDVPTPAAAPTPAAVPTPAALAPPARVAPASAQVSCGDATVTWSSVGQVCGSCKAVVPNIVALYPTCHDYCAQQGGGLECVDAWDPTTVGCDTIMKQSCDHTFDALQPAMCECKASASASALTDTKVQTQMRYLQCGGQGWTGLTACEVGTVCLATNDFYSACVPLNEVDKAKAQAKAQAEKDAAKAAVSSAVVPSAAGAAAAGAAAVAGAASVAGSIRNGASSVVGSLTDGASSTVGSIADGATSAVGSITNGASSAVGSVTDGVSSTVGSITNGATSAVGSIADGATSSVGSIADGATLEADGAASVLGRVGSIPDSATTAVGTLAGGASSAAGAVAGGASVAVDGATSAAGSFKNTGVAAITDAKATAGAGASGMPWWGWVLLVVGIPLCVGPCVAYGMGCFNDEKKRTKRGLKKKLEAVPALPEVELEAAPLVPQVTTAEVAPAQVLSYQQLAPVQQVSYVQVPTFARSYQYVSAPSVPVHSVGATAAYSVGAPNYTVVEPSERRVSHAVEHEWAAQQVTHLA